MILTWLLTFAAFVIPVVLQGYESSHEGFLMPAQMQAQGVAQGLPFIAHTGMWSDITLFAALMATIVNSFARQWTIGSWGAALVTGLIASAVMHWCFYVNAPFPEAHVRDGVVTPVGIIHFFYMAAGIAILILFYGFTANLSPVNVKIASALLFVHVVIGTLIPLKIWAAVTRPTWYPAQPVLDGPTIVTIVGVAVMLLAASWWALRETQGHGNTG